MNTADAEATQRETPLRQLWQELVAVDRQVVVAPEVEACSPLRQLWQELVVAVDAAVPIELTELTATASATAVAEQVQAAATTRVHATVPAADQVHAAAPRLTARV